jgi:GTP-binding protein Era
LLNALVGEKVAITAHQAQTTRTSIQGVMTTPEAQVIFIDTPGFISPTRLFNKRMMDTVRGALQDRDLVIFVADATKPVTEEDEHALSALNKTGQTLLVLNKIDKVSDKRLLLPVIERYNELFPFSEAFPIAARKGEGLDELKKGIIKHLPGGPRFFRTII